MNTDLPTNNPVVPNVPVTPAPQTPPKPLFTPATPQPAQAPNAQAPAPQPRPAPAAPKFLLPPLLWKQSQELLQKIEQKLGGAVISYYARSSIVGDDVKYFYTHLDEIGHRDRLYFVLYSSGGDGMSAYRIASLLKNFCDELVIVIPEMAASAATMLSLSGDSIIMTPLAFLTAVDTSVTHPLNPKDSAGNPVRIELEEIKRSVHALSESLPSDASKMDIYKTIFNYIHPAAFGNMERTSNLSEMLCRDIIKLRTAKGSDDSVNALINKLNSEYPAHGYPITRKNARELGLPVVDSDSELDLLLWKYINTNRILTEPVRTDCSDTFIHTESYTKSIESVGRRYSVRNIYERKQEAGKWGTIRDEYKWEALYEEEVDGAKKLKITTLDF